MLTLIPYVFFFRTDDDKLVLIDVTGGIWDMAKEKQKKLKAWIATSANELRTKHKIKGVMGVMMALIAKWHD